MTKTPEEIVLQLDQIIEYYVEKRLLDVHTCLPGKIKSYDAAKQKAEVIPLMESVFEDETKVKLPVIVNVPVHTLQGGDASSFINIPVKTGATGAIFISERSLEKFLSSDGTAQLDPEDNRIFDLTDAFFLVGFNSFPKALSGLSTSDMQLHNKEGHVDIKALTTGKQIRLGNNPTDNPVLYSTLDTVLTSIWTALDAALTGVGIPSTTLTTWNAEKATTQCNKVKLPPSTEI